MNTCLAAAQPAVFNEQAYIQVGKWLQAAGYYFVTVTPATHARVAARHRKGEARSLRDIFGWSMPFRATDLPEVLVSLLQRAGGLEPAGNLLRSKVRYSTLGDTLYMHSAYPTVDADAVFFGPDTYRFVGLIQRTLANSPPMRVNCAIDVGCGGGAGGIAAVTSVQNVPSEIILADISPTALRYAEVNTALAGVKNVILRQGDLFNTISEAPDLIMANPPYLLDSQARLYRHGGGALGSELSRRIVVEGLPRLRAEGALILYTGAPIVNGVDTFWQSVAPVIHDANISFDYSEIDPDVFGEELQYPAYAHVERIAAVALVIRKLSGSAPDCVTPNLPRH